MSRKPETTVKNRVNKKVAEAGVYQQSMSAMFSNGLPDHYYEGCLDALHIEWKRVPKFTRISMVDPYELCSSIQSAWIFRARENGRRAWVVVGDDQERYLVWQEGWDPRAPELFWSADEVASAIIQLVGDNNAKRPAHDLAALRGIAPVVCLPTVPSAAKRRTKKR